MTTRDDKRAYVFHDTVTVAAIRLWVRTQGIPRSLRILPLITT
ncbi:hypothetical protein ACIGCZ_33515 [Streptomyces nigra]|nr:hypothetical protein [Streptomyces sp. JHA19]